MLQNKHFPGHGDTETDSHLGLSILPFDKNRLYNIELKPFKEAIKKGVNNIMTGHIIIKEMEIKIIQQLPQKQS